ncbi:hypothetical protein KL918_004189 [Ogataea parapolymorpha]|uniref:Delta(14)-sterol reductase n=1 Tax=Ogataea parapolymorpha (strain ATCC 26012 / BCRC 20466 / JCM 22074 / NRRL Y-7560 / DL-1) TaxID=871575 RepID=W1QII6_OGAPD|nr:Delta(14)-sterol reductase [Ogataea parapolymorpha DL-1]ESX01446.1 Delta(14)-sterol reductase [Ogataea parapolymorpha DL-1]KAG7865710.1 hypothetical protein KL918_004189 [Ogataea parapolymorpha]KAG7869645.1 hypothetical protein KL916_005226 [Ogataea parapolymorpha]
MLNPFTVHKDFFGFPGALILTFSLPLVVVFLYAACNERYVVEGCNLQINTIRSLFAEQLTKETFFNAKCWIAYLVWFFGLALLDLIVPGYYKKGTTLRDGTHLTYLINGKELSLLLCGALAARALYTRGNVPELQFIYDNFLPLMVVSWEFSLILSTFVYLCSYFPLRRPNGAGTYERILAEGGNSKNVVFDWFIGRELNPRIGPWDIKLFCELRPGMLLWLLIDLSCVQKQYLETGTVANSLLFVVAMQSFYIFDGVLNEEGVLSMMDITTDGFGFMLAFGDLCWVPFTYSLQARYLSLRPVHLSSAAFSGVVAIMAIGYYIFHSSNSQKSKFRQGLLPHMKSIKTERGTSLLVEGWWGLSQHINYFGDLLIALSWCLPTGFGTPLTYFYVIYFAFLLLHRQKRDEHKCRTKYGKSWTEYEKLVPYKIVPYVY